jgi:hypothetical protein
MRKSAGLAAVLLLVGHGAEGQDSRASPPLPALPQIYEMADVKIRVKKVADGLANPSAATRSTSCAPARTRAGRS